MLSLCYLTFPLAGAFVVFFDAIVFVVVELVVAKVVVSATGDGFPLALQMADNGGAHEY